MIAALRIFVVAFGGGAWRWWDGRGFGPGGVRLGVCFVFAAWICRDLGFTPWETGWLPWQGGYAAIVALLFAAVWTPRQKNREELDDMLLRWTFPFMVLGVIIAFVTLNWLPIVIMALTGLAIALLVWGGVHWKLPASWTWWPSWLDTSAITEALAGVCAFYALDYTVSFASY